MHELYFGAFRSQRREANLSRIDALRFEVLPLDVEDVLHAGEIRLVLVTRNLREFDRVPGLVTEN
ncbi:hypothetical protein [Nevskia ramosa]|uniref:hypothetical protein n=1 Tax=Nevskia ramosa TaxID=64002 RepID=UPI003D1243D5